MIKKFSVLFSVFALLLCLGTYALGQETTGDIEITVKDPNGAVVPNVSITITSSESTAGFKRTVTTNEQGFVRVIKIPPGLYTVTAAATAGFAERVIPAVPVSLGRVTPVTVDLGVANIDPNTVTVNSSDVNPIDTSSTKIETTISAQTAELLPKGTNFASVLKISPATRVEPRSGQFQIDGASGSENTFIIDGQEVTNIRTGVLDANSNLPFQLIQEVQIKSSGFEAEYGGATGGVINVVTKGGGNEYRGEVGAMFRPSGLNALSRPGLRLDVRFPPSGRAEYFHPQRDKYLEFNPSGNIGGPIIKNRLWFFGSYTPQIFERTRNIAYLVDDNPRIPTGRVETYKFRQVREYAFLRLDGQPFSKLRLNAAYTWNPVLQRGAIPDFASALATVPVLPGSNPPISGGRYQNFTGGRQNSQSITGQAVWTITNDLFVSARAGHYFLNEKLGTYGQGNPLITRVLCSGLSPTQFPGGFGCLRGFNNGVPLVGNTLFDATTRNTFDVDGTYIFNAGGRHELKGGYQSNKIGNKVDDRTTDQIVLRYGQPIWSYASGTETSLPASPNAVGSGQLVVFSTRGNVTSKNEAIYIQDKWQPISRLTFNLGIRTERENIPSFAPGLPGIKFDFQDKLAPRLGAAFDLTGDGKTKISVFYGLFYDRFKYELPRGSFGGDEFHGLFFEIFPGDTLSSFTRASILGNGTPIPGGSCPSTLTPIFGRVRCDRDNRVSSNSGGLLTEVGGVDPNIKAFQQSEFTVTFERDLGRNFLFSSRYTRKNVEHTVEDAGFPNAAGSEFYIIGNPGEGLYKRTAEAFGLKAIVPQRLYQALEFRFDRRFANNFYFNLNYTYSRLYGNYSGLASSDEDGRLSPNVNRFFDQPGANWSVAGGEDNGLLATDRPHVIKFNGAYNFNWDRFDFGKGHETSFQLFTTFQSGTPVTTTISVNNIDNVLTKRGDLGRTEMFTETDFGIRHRYRFGQDNRFSLIGEVDILNLFNEANVTNRIPFLDARNDYDVRSLITQAERDACAVPGASQQPCYIAGYKIFQNSGAPSFATQANLADNRYPLYNFASAFQGPRQVRFGLRFLF